jgi:hypothetical protein|uniref:Uncharacterized protein n=1 Tax=Siphoviridae sp. ctpoI7 TaxID=2825678 RepID=A0A8S5P9D8_9CAUD|nr:MAG TPA: hypothetical protein [Siphoviridae sp. ctpoI7]
MGKTIRKTIQITTRKRNNSVKINEEFYSYDKKNAQFEFLMDYDIPADKVIALFHFENSNRYYETLCQFKGNLITIEFDTSLIVEDELVTGYLYFDKLDKSTDVYRFTFGVRVSEIDKTRELPVQEKVSRRIVPIEDIATKTDVREMIKSLRIENGTVDNDKIESLINSKVNDRLGWIGEQLLSHNSFQQNQGKTNNDIFRMIDEIKERFNNLSNIYLSSHQSLEHLATKDALGKIEQRVEQLEQNRGSQPAVDNHDFVTRQELEDKHYLTSIPEEYAKTTDLTNFAANSKVEAVESRVLALENKPSVVPQGYDDSALSGRVSALEAKQDKDTVYNDEEIKRRLTTLEGKTDNFITGVSVNKEGNNVTLTYNYVDGQSKNVSFTDSDTVNVAYDDSGLKQRITNLENRPQVDLTDYAKKSELYNDSEIKQRLTALENNHVTHDSTGLDETQFVSPAELEAKHYLTETQAESVYAKKSEIPNTTNFATTDSVNNLLRAQGEQATKISALENKSAYEIHGTGMPNGQVEAPIGTTYVDMNVTNGALKWIKHSGNGNTGWKVLIGDTGWRTLNSVSRLGNSFIKIRRVNNLVTYNFGGLQWGWFGIIRRNGPGFAKHNSTGDRGAKVLYPGGIPEGFRSENSLIGGIYNDAGKPYGIWYLGGKSDSNYIQFSFNDPIPTDKDIGDIRVSAISYVTDEDWPTTLP